MPIRRVKAKVTLEMGPLNGLIKRFKGVKRIYADLGYFDEKEDSRYEGDISVADVAVINEYGSPELGIPPRPFFQNTLREQGGFNWWFKARAKDLFLGDASLGKLMESFAKIAVSYFKETIISFDDPPNRPDTIRKKGKDDPLIETGNLLERFRHRIRRVK